MRGSRAHSMPDTLTLSHLWAHYGEHVGLRDVSATLAGPGVIGLLGRNGAGKSTLLHILAGLLLPSSGSISWRGEDVSAQPSTLRELVGFLPETPALHDEMRVQDFLHWCATIRGVARAQRAERVHNALRTGQLEQVAKLRIGALSHGFRKRVGIAQAMVHDPAMILLDEPISGLDPAQIAQMRQVIRALGERALVVVSSHILEEITKTCARVLLLEQGALRAERAIGAHTPGALRMRLALVSSQASTPELTGARIVRAQQAGEGKLILSVDLDDEAATRSLARECVAQGFDVLGLEAVNPTQELEAYFLETFGEEE